jgi:hypothetical protein
VSRETLRGWIIEAKLWRAQPQCVEKVHTWRPRRSRIGELVQWDTSEHDWLEGRGPKLYLISMIAKQSSTGRPETMIGDATSRLVARFVEHDSTEENMPLLAATWKATADRCVSTPTRRRCLSLRPKPSAAKSPAKIVQTRRPRRLGVR